MSTYKVIQDIEAEDHILGPLSLRQFIYALIAVFFFYLCFICLSKGASFLLVIFLPPGLFCAFFAFPFGKDQPTEVWALAKIRFLFKPRRRIWNQSGIKELVTITVPKKIEIQRTDGLSQTEVKSRLRGLADTLDSRGWVVKNLSTNVYAPSVLAGQDNSERLLSITSIPQPVPDFDIPGSADVLDERMSPLAQQFDSMINTAAQNRRKQLMDELAGTSSAPAPNPTPQWFTPSVTQTAQPAPVQTTVTPTETEEAEAAAQLKASLAAQAQVNAKLHIIPTAQEATIPHDNSSPAPVTQPTDPVILNLAKNNDLNVATLAREAGKAKDLGDDEVVISLH